MEAQHLGVQRLETPFVLQFLGHEPLTHPGAQPVSVCCRVSRDPGNAGVPKHKDLPTKRSFESKQINKGGGGRCRETWDGFTHQLKSQGQCQWVGRRAGGRALYLCLNACRTSLVVTFGVTVGKVLVLPA